MSPFAEKRTVVLTLLRRRGRLTVVYSLVEKFQRQFKKKCFFSQGRKKKPSPKSLVALAGMLCQSANLLILFASIVRFS